MDMEKLVSLCKRRGFLFQSSEIYGGLNGFWDYGPLGVELKRNVKEAWWRDMVTGHDDLAAPPGAPSPTRWSASIARSSCTRRSGSARAITTCSTTSWSIAASRRSATATTRSAAAGSRPRASGSSSPSQAGGDEGWPGDRAEGAEVLQPARQERRRAGTGKAPLVCADHGQGLSRRCSGPTPRTLGTLTRAARIQPDVQDHTSARSAARKTPPSCAPKRPRASSSTSRTSSTAAACSVPFGIAQIGKSFRNEITPRNFTFRSREFEQMEIEFFCHPRPVARVVPVLARPALSTGISTWAWPASGCGCASIDADELSHYSVRHGRHRIRLSVPAAGRVRRAGRRRPSRRLRPAQPHGRQARARKGDELGRRDWTPTASRGIAGSGKDLTLLRRR